MSDRHGQSSGGENGITSGTHAACRVSYTLNNEQPVTSTFIGEQPLFYMDMHESDDELGYIDDIEYGLMEHEIETLEKEIKTLERFSGSFEDYSDRLFEDLLENAADITNTDTETEQENNYSFLVSRLRKVISESRLAGAFLNLADDHHVEIKCSTQIQYSFYDRRSGTILLNPQNSFESLTLLAIKELRLHWQHRNGALINPLLFHPDSAVLVNRAQIADLSVSLVRAAWELQLSGHKEIWDRIENSTMADLGHAFAREAFLDFRTINNGVACAAVFESWFLSERCQAQDKSLIQQMLADHQGYVFDLNDLSQGLTPELISALGTMPFGKNYLATHAGIILEDPVFTDIRDRSNANFLWFIKFERSFRETEHDLQNHPDYSPSGQGDRQGLSHRSVQDVNHEQGTAQIIKLAPEHYARITDAEEHARSGQTSEKILFSKEQDWQDAESAGDNVVYLGRWFAE